MTIEEFYNEAKKRNATDMELYFVDHRVPEGFRPECAPLDMYEVDVCFGEDWAEISPGEKLD